MTTRRAALIVLLIVAAVQLGGQAYRSEIAGVPGLPDELAARPRKGAGYAPSRAIKSNAAGELEAVTGTLTNCVLVDGTSGPCGTAGVSGTGPSVIGYVPSWLDTGATSIGPGFAVSQSATNSSIVQRDSSGGMAAKAGIFTFLFGQRDSDGLSAQFRRFSSGQTSNLVSFETEAGVVLSSIDKDGKFPATALVGNLPVANLNGGTGANSSTFWRGDGVWATPPASGGGATGSYTQSFTSQTSVTLTHALGSKNILVACYDGSDQAIDWNTLVATSTSAAAVTFTSAQTGRCTVTIGGGSARYSTTFSSQTSVTITGATHNLGTPDIHVQCRDGSSPRRIVEPNTVDVDDSTYDVVITFSVAQSGRCTIL